MWGGGEHPNEYCVYPLPWPFRAGSGTNSPIRFGLALLPTALATSGQDCTYYSAQYTQGLVPTALVTIAKAERYAIAKKNTKKGNEKK